MASAWDHERDKQVSVLILRIAVTSPGREVARTGKVFGIMADNW